MNSSWLAGWPIDASYHIHMHARLWRFLFNLFPAFRGTGAKITFIAADWSEVRVKVPLSWRTRKLRRHHLWRKYVCRRGSLLHDHAHQTTGHGLHRLG